MRQIFIALFIIALLAGITAKILKDSKDQTSFVGHFFHLSGIKQKEDKQKEEVLKMIQRIDSQKEKVKDDMLQQKAMIENSSRVMSSFSQHIKESLDKDNNADLLRLKDLMQRFEDRNTLLIENGNEILKSFEEQKAINQQMAKDFDQNSNISKIEQQRFMETIGSSLEQQKQKLEQYQSRIREVQDGVKEILNQSRQMRLDNISHEGSSFLGKLKNISDATQSMLEQINEHKQKIADMKDRTKEVMQNMKEKTDDLNRKLQDSIDHSRQNIREEDGFYNNRLRDKLDRMQDQKIGKGKLIV